MNVFGVIFVSVRSITSIHGDLAMHTRQKVSKTFSFTTGRRPLTVVLSWKPRIRYEIDGNVYKIRAVDKNRDVQTRMNEHTYECTNIRRRMSSFIAL